MTSMAFDTLRYNRRLLEAGVPEPQAEVQAELMAEAFGFYAANLLTKDHFTEVLNARFSEFGAVQDLRFAEQDAKFEKCFSAIDQRLLEQDVKFDKRFAAIDQRFLEQDAKFDKRFAVIDQRFLEQEAKSDKRFAEQDAKWSQLFAQMNRTMLLPTWMLGIIVVVLVVPQLQAWFA